MKSMKRFTILGSAMMFFALPAPQAVAHGDMNPQHGGQVRMSGETVVELVSIPAGVEVYLREEDEPLPAEAYAAKLIVTSAGERREVELAPGGGNRLIAEGVTVPAGASVVVSLTSRADGKRIFATYGK